MRNDQRVKIDVITNQLYCEILDLTQRTLHIMWSADKDILPPYGGELRDDVEEFIRAVRQQINARDD